MNATEVEIAFSPWPYDARDRGIALLDAKRPGWRDRIDLDNLNLLGCSGCVLGQVFGDFEDGLVALGLDKYSDASHYGFHRPNGVGHGYERLTAAWREALVEHKP